MKKSIIRKPISILLSLVMLLSVFVGMSFTASAANMYQISSYAELKAFANAVNGGATDANAILTADIIADGTDWTPIGYLYRPYIGTFDGDGHTITGLSTESNADRDFVGLFGYVGDAGVVQNVGMISGSIKGRNWVGAVAGCIDGQILNCYNTGEVTATDDSADVGGVVGAIYRGGTVQSCYNTGTVSGLNAYAGGVVGLNVEGTVQNCYNTGDVSGGIVGGVAGENNADRRGRAEISNCFNTGTISGNNSAGGVAGRNLAEVYMGTSSTVTVTNCYNMGEVSVNGDYTDVGGVVGRNLQNSGCSAEVTNCYSAGTVTASGYNSSADGVAGDNNGTVQNCYYDSDVCDANNNIGTRLTTAQMTGMDALSNMPGLSSVKWLVRASDEFYNYYPHLKGFAYDDTATAADWPARKVKNGAMEIANYDELKAFAAAVNGGQTGLKAILKSDIAATDKEWTPIGNELKPYIGIFDGDGHTITGLSNEDVANAPINAGLFGWLGENAKVKNVRLTGVDLKATYYLGAVAGDAKGAEITNCRNTGEINCTASQVGGIIGSIRGAIVSNCCNTGDITSTANNAYVGGIAGFLCGDQSAAGITNCYNTGTVTGKGRYSNVGGIAGYANDRNCTVEIANCYNTGAVTATGTSSRAGGIAASSCVFDGGTVEVINCYSAGAVTADQNVGGVIGLKYNSVVRNCYYDSDVCGLSSAIGKIDDTDDVKGLHTDEMTGASALTQMPFSDPSAWLVKGTTNLYEFYPHLKGFDFNADGSQKEASAIDAADWPAKIAHSHTYGEPVWSWEKDHSKATATFTCSGCGDEQTVTDDAIDVTVVSAEDCTNDRVVTYTAGVTFAGAPYENAVKNVTLPDTATGHTYGDTGDDRFTCTVCGAEDAARKAAAALADAKAAAKTELENYKDPADYRPAQQDELTAAVDAGKSDIDAAADIDAVNNALTAAKAVIDAIKTDAQLAAEELAADTAAADAVEAKIDAIGEVAYTDESKAKIDDARAAYDDLTDAQKALVDNKDTLEKAEDDYQLLDDKNSFEEYKDELKQAAEEMRKDDDSDESKKLIDDTIDAINKMEYDESKSLDDNKQAVDDTAKLDELTDDLTDQRAADEVEKKINDIGEVALTNECKDKIDEAREAYDNLTDEQKALVDNKDTLEKAEDDYQLLDDKNSFEEYKDELKQAAEEMRKDDDSDESKKLIDDAVAAIDAMEYDETKSLDDNKQAVDDTAKLNELTEQLEDHRAIYYAVFKADGKEIASLPYTIDTVSLSEPAVPVKDNYTGAWPQYELKEGGVEINAVYTKNGALVITDNAKEQGADRVLTFTETVTFTTDTSSLPEGATLCWYVNGEAITAEKSVTVESPKDDYTVQVKAFAKDGTLYTESEVLTVKVEHTLWAKIVAVAKLSFTPVFNAMKKVIPSFFSFLIALIKAIATALVAVVKSVI